MKAYGYINDVEQAIELKEIVLECDIREIEKLISFLTITKERHEYFNDSEEPIHTHYRDWNKEWEKDEVDIVISTN